MVLNSHKLLVSAILAAAVAATAAPATAKTLDITVAAAPPPAVTFVSAFKDIVVPKIDERLKASGQDFEIKWNHAYSQTLAKFPEVFEAVEQGIAGAGLILKNFEPSTLPLEAYVAHVPFVSTTRSQLVEIDATLREKIPALNEAYAKHNQVFIASGTDDSMQMYTKFPLQKFEDLDGRKLGSSGSLGVWLQGTGAVTVNSSMNQSFTNIKNGVYEGYPISEILSFVYKTWSAAPYFTKVDFGPSVTSAITFNADTWKSIPSFAQKIIREEAANWVTYMQDIDDKKRAKFIAIMAEGGVKSSVLPPEERKRWAMAMPNVAMEWAARQDERGLPGTELLKTYLAELKARNVELARDWGQK